MQKLWYLTQSQEIEFCIKLLGHIISKYGIKIHPKRVNVIMKVEEPKSKKEVQPFIGHVNFLRIFIPSFYEILRNITNMLKK